MKIYAQREWNGIAKKTPYDNDPMTSQIEINTEPGKGELKRINSRSALLDEPLPAPAIRFNNVSSCLVTKTADGSGFKMFDVTEHSYHQYAAICFKFNELSGFSLYNHGAGSDEYFLFKCGNFGCSWDTAEDKLNFYYKINDEAQTNVEILSTFTFEANTWYWLYVIHNVSADTEYLTARIYTEGLEEYTEDADFVSMTAAQYLSNPDEKEIYLGQNDSPISIAYFGWRVDATETGITPWTPYLVDTTGNDGVHFLPRDPRKTIFPAQIGSNTVKASWVVYPRPGITLANYNESYGDSVGTLDEENVKGIVSTCGRGHLLDLSGEELFNRTTVFMFNVSASSQEIKATLLRSYDSLFSIYTDGDYLYVRWMPDSFDESISAGGACIVSTSSSLIMATDSWFAVEFDPDNEDESDLNPLFKIYRWSSSDWVEVAWESTSVCGTGIDVPSSTEWKLLQRSNEKIRRLREYYQLCLLDFRIIIGDDSWTTTYTVGESITSIPSTLKCWINLDDNNYWPRDENCNTVELTSGDDTGEIIAISDRVTGSYRLFPDRYGSDIQWDACPYLNSCYHSVPEDVKSDDAGNVYGPTDGPWYYNSTGSPLISNRTLARKKCSTVGIHKYIAGGGQLQRVNIPNKPIRFPSVFFTVADENVNNDIHPNTKIHEGDLSYDTQYRFKVTLYDPATGNESNPRGPFWFDTGDYSDTSSDETCAHEIEMYIESNTDVGCYLVKFYRYHTATGTYRYEGMSGVSSWDTTSSYAEGSFHTSKFAFSISDTALALRSAVEEDNDDPPYHIYSALWAGRAWYVPALNPSRIRFSKLYYFGKCPTTSICWTDEGATGDILGLMPGFGGLLLLKENSIWIIPQADNTAGYMAQLLIPDIGVVSADAAVFVNGALWFADNSGIYTFDGNSIQQVSDKLDGLERNVWDGNPRKTRAYYDKENWKVVFVCEGTAITFDSRTGAASLCGLPDSCYGFMSSSDYSGSLYGQDGMIMKEFKGNMGLALTNEDYEQGGNTYGPSITFSYENGDVSDLTAITEYWSDGTNSGSTVIGYSESGIGDSTVDYLNISSIIGSTFTQWNTDDISVTRDYDICCNTIHISPDVNTIYLKTLPGTGLTEYYLGIIPMYYKSQNIYFDVDQSDKIIEQLSVLFGDWVRGTFYNFYLSNGEEYLELNKYCPVVTVDYTAETLGEYFTSNEVTSGEEAFVEDRYFFRLPVQRKGYRGYYEVLSKSFENLPPVKSIFLHYNVLRPRGGGKYR